MHGNQGAVLGDSSCIVLGFIGNFLACIISFSPCRNGTLTAMVDIQPLNSLEDYYGLFLSIFVSTLTQAVVFCFSASIF